MALKTDRERTAHLLRRFGLGASESELDYYAEGGWRQAVNRLLEDPKAERTDLDIFAFANDKGQLRIQSVQAFWFTKMLTTRNPLREKMTLFWHDHFATSAQKVTQPLLMHEQNETFRTHALGNFKDLLREASKDPAMLVWLDNQYNVKGKPNENFAREVMELFTLGIGNYTEQDIQEAARAFTGWTFRGADRTKPKKGAKPEFVFDRRKHDDGVKTICGSQGPFDGETVLDLLAEDKRTARYLCEKLWAWFAYPDPEPIILETLVGTFIRSGLEIKPVLRAIMENEGFYSTKAERTQVKNPVDFVIPTLRQLGIGEVLDLSTKEDGTLTKLPVVAVGLTTATKAMGMNLLFPPDVAGWDSGTAWISSATMIERVRWADRIFGVTPAGTRPSNRQVNVSLPVHNLLQRFETPERIVDALLSMFDAPLAASKRGPLVAAAEKALAGGLNQKNASVCAASVCRLIFGAPEFQFC